MAEATFLAPFSITLFSLFIVQCLSSSHLIHASKFPSSTGDDLNIEFANKQHIQVGMESLLAQSRTRAFKNYVYPSIYGRRLVTCYNGLLPVGSRPISCTITRRRGFSRGVIKYYANSVAGFNYEYLCLCGDISSNPGPASKENCSVCKRTVASTHRAISCDCCSLWTHIKCGGVTSKEYNRLQSVHDFSWTCPTCLHQLQQMPFGNVQNVADAMTTLPFTGIEDTELLTLIQGSEGNDNCRPNDQDSYLQELVHKLATSAKNLKIAHLNIRGLRKKIDELGVLLKLCRFDILGITETHLKREITDGEISIDDYDFIRKDRTHKQGGGCIVYYRKSLKIIHRQNLENPKIEMICLEVKAGSRDVLIGTVYRPPNNNEFFTEFPKTLEKLWMKYANMVLIGDFNCNLFKHSHRDPSHEGIRMTNILEQFNMSNVIETPTRITSNSRTLIDLILTTRKDLVKLRGTCPMGISDHDMIYATLSTRMPKEPPKIINTRNYKRFNETEFRRDIERIPYSVCSVFEDPSDTYHAWNLLFTDVCNDHAPFKKTKIRSNTLPWITKEIRTTMNKRYKTLKEARKTNDPTIWNKYKSLRNKVSTMIKETKSSYYADLFNEVKTASAYWKLLKKAAGDTKTNKQIGQLKRTDGTITVDNNEKANLLNQYFCTVAEGLIGPAIPKPVTPNTDIHPDVHGLTELRINMKTIETKIHELQPRKATGPDEVSARLLKSAGPSIVPSLTSVFEHSARACKPPDQWKVARVSAVFKKGSKEDRTCYRPLSMLSIPSKIMETCVAENINNYTAAAELLDSRQWAYKKGKSTEQLLIHLTEKWRSSIEKKLFVGILFIDFTKAFDTVSHNILLHKLSGLGINGNIWKWLREYLTNRKQFVKINGSDSDTLNIHHGIPQGSVLGPTLFSLFTNDLPTALPSGETYLFADDTTIFCIAESMDVVTNKLNNALKEVKDWCDKNSLVPHPGKCKAMVIHRKTFIGPLQALKLGNSIVHWTKSERVLGVQVDNKLNWSDHTSTVTKSYAAKLSLLRRMRFLPQEQLEDFYTKVILPSITYGSLVWGSCNETQLRNLEKLHARAGRIIYGLPSDTSTEEVLTRTGWDTLDTMYKKRLIVFTYKCINNQITEEFIGLFKQNQSIRSMRSGNNTLSLPTPETNYMRNSVSYRGAVLWNSLNQEIRMAETTGALKHLLKESNIHEFKFNISGLNKFKDCDYYYY